MQIGFWVFMWSFNIVSDSRHVQPTQKINLRQPIEVKTKTCCQGHNHINKLLYLLCLFSYLVSQFCFSFFLFSFLRKKLNNIIKKDQLNQPEIQKKAVVEHPPSTLKVWNINSVSSQTMSNKVLFCYIGSSSNNKLCNLILASLFFTFFCTLATS